MTPTRVCVTADAKGLIRKLIELNGPLMFHQSGGCCDGSSPMCYLKGEFRVGQADVLLGQLEIEDVDSQSYEPVSVWMSKAQFQYWKHTQITIDVVDGRGGGFSLESPYGKRFLTRSRVFSDAECEQLDLIAITTGA